MARVRGKVAIVTGGASGIGRGCAERLAAEGAQVVVTDIQDALGEEVAAQLNAHDGVREAGGGAVYMSHDVTDEERWQSLVEEVESRLKGLHVLVNNAGIGIGGSIVEMPLADWQRQQAINLDGVFLGVKHSIPAMVRSGSGSIINMSSVAGLKGAANLAAYNATKGGVRLFTKGVALECAEKRWPVRVNSVHPGIIDTPIWTKVNAEYFTEGENALDVEVMAEEGVPTGKAGYPVDIANGVLFLASDESSYVTGTELVIDGGLSA